MGKLTKPSGHDPVVVTKDADGFLAAIKVSDRVELENVRLMSCRCEHRRFVPRGEKTLSMKRHAEGKLDEKASRVFVMVDFSLDVFVSGEDSSNPFATLVATFLLVYCIKDYEGITQECIDQFAETNGVYNAWPYWREFIQSTGARMSLPNLTVPVLRLGKPVLSPSAVTSTKVPEATSKTGKAIGSKAKAPAGRKAVASKSMSAKEKTKGK